MPDNVSSVDLDSDNKEFDEASKQNYSLILDGDFEVISLGEDPRKGVKI
jgi:hypothetical protein